MARDELRHEFRVVIEGAELSEDVLRRVNAAVQKSAMTELASLDLAGDFHFRFPIPRPEPPWWGLWLQRVSRDQLDRAGIKTPQEFGESE